MRRATFCLFALVPAPLFAQVAPSTQDLDGIQVLGSAPSYSAPRASTATRTDAAVLDVSQSIQTVTAAMLDDQRVRTLDDAVSNVSGLMLAPSRAGTQDAFIRRGFGDSSTGSILRDGVRSMQNRNFSATTEQVEVLKGPASTLYGIQEPGGVINVISKQPLARRQTSLQLDTSDVGGGGGVIDHTGSIGESGFSYRTIASYDDTDYWRAFGTQRRSLLAPSLAWRNADTEVMLALEHGRYDTPFDDGTIFVDGKPLAIPRERPLTERYSKMEGQTDYANLRVRHRLSDAWTLRATYAFSRNQYDDVRVRADGYNADTGLLRRRFDGRRGVDDRSQYVVADALGHLGQGWLRHELLLGIDHESTRNHTDGELARVRVNGFDVWNPVYGAVPAPTAIDPETVNANAALTSTSLFVQDAISLGEHWIVSGAARYQQYKQREGVGTDYAITQDLDDHKVLPRLGVVYKLSGTVSLYANYATSFTPNLASDPTQGAFDPEEGVVHELGAKLDLGNRLTATAALYQTTKRNIVISLDDDTARAIGEARARGVELDVAGQLTDALRVVGAYAYTDAEITDDLGDTVGNTLPNVARHQASLSLFAKPTWQTGPLRWQFGAGVRYAGKRQGDEDNSFTLPSYVVADLSAGTRWAWGAHDASLDVGLRNVFDRDYYPFADGTSRVMIGEPRRLEARFKLAF
ncbi:iron complex outermembrane recepter protein [Pseudoxanthomonas sp. GM95]|uniref:TonB-dependent siderophore receptor n=1 Tax=Pseudoxanthomonas sp. GM95 TaxID=1881043 RepID=UPI0008AF8771|nr:TonB-dependent siderophore receptor [Pseudoxanthomonas sp. GM95]SEL75490.1 iron complex outermembrane recepter protein [Pseudoxanthomonas sp. GM95]